ncbi:MAG: TonB-dependent siderophore receptor [PS1 clade bacterium]|nr:TonB-dependent siderophore receptor [PS1 clade bacterium]
MALRLKNALLLAAITPVLMAQASAQDASVDEIVVTSTYEKPNSSALKMPVPLIDVPQSLSIISQEEMKMRGYDALSDMVRYTPGINTSQGEGHRDAIVFRGVRSTADFFLDGVRDDVQYYRPLYNLEQVEILRGPNALLFGRGGTGGAVNRVTKKAIIGKQTTEVDVSLDSFGAYNLAADVNMETGSHSALRVNAFVETLENDRDFYDGDRMGVNPTLRVALSEQTSIDVSLELMDHERFIDRGIPTGADGAPVDSLRDIVFGSPTDNITTLEATILRGTVNHQFSDTLTGVLNLHYGDYEKMYQNLYASGYDADANTVQLDGYRDPTERTHTVLSGHLVNQFSAGGMGHTLLVGGEYIDTQSENLRFNTCWDSKKAANADECDSDDGTDKETFSISNPLNLTAVDFDTDLNNQTETEITVTSLFVQDQIAVNDNLQVLLGARLDNFDITVKDVKNADTQSREDEEVSTRFGVIYKPQSNISLYASMSESFLPRSGEQYKKLEESAARLDPDVYENTEFGLKWDISEALNVAVSLFDNEQETAVSSGDGSAYIQGLTVDGYEVEVKGRVSDATSVSFGYTSLDGETKDGDTPRELPETMYSLFVERQANERLNYGIGLTYQDKSLIKDGSTAYLPDYTRIDASLSYIVSDDMTLRVNIENLTDEEYYPHSHSTHQVSVGDPMNAKISLTRKF